MVAVRRIFDSFCAKKDPENWANFGYFQDISQFDVFILEPRSSNDFNFVQLE